jgi:hypothetical protein
LRSNRSLRSDTFSGSVRVRVRVTVKVKVRVRVRVRGSGSGSGRGRGRVNQRRYCNTIHRINRQEAVGTCEACYRHIRDGCGC